MSKHSSTPQNNKSSLESLASRIYLEVDGVLLKEVESYINSLEDDLNLLFKLDLSNCPIYYGNPALQLSSSTFENKDKIKIENRDLLEVFASSYEFINIQSQE